MKKIALLIVSILALSSCVSAHTSALPHGSLAEQQAWQNANAIAQRECDITGGVKSREKSEAIKIAKCNTRIINEHFVPHARYPKFVSEWRTQQEKIAEQFQKGEITKEQADARSESSMATLRNKYDIQGRSGQAIANVVKKEQRRAAINNSHGTNTNQAMWALGQALMQTPASSGECDAISIRPIAAPGCTSVCINGRWAEAC